MKSLSIIVSVLVIGFISGCSGSTDSGQSNIRSSSNSTRIDRAGTKKDPDQIPSDSQTQPGSIGEDLKILKDMVASQVSIANQQLIKANLLKFKVYEMGTMVAYEDCRALEKAVSSQYPLSTYHYQRIKEDAEGVHLCPDIESRYDWEKEEINSNSIQFKASFQPSLSSFGRKGVKTLTVSYSLQAISASVFITNQYLIDHTSKIIERTQSIVRNGKVSSTMMSSLDEQNNLLSLTEQNWEAIDEPYRLKSAARFAAVDGSIDAILRNQTDGVGINTQIMHYTLPKDMNFEAVELSVLSKFTIYQIGEDVTDWPYSQYSMTLISKSGQTCGSGYIGFTPDGSRIRNFGDYNCSTTMDVSKSVE